LGADTTTAIVSTVASLWPDADVRLQRGRRTDPGAVAEFAVVPHARSPRLLVPVHRRASAAALLRFSSAVSARETAGRLALSAVLRTGAAAFPDRITVHGDDAGSLASYLAEVAGEPVTFSLGIGTARVNRKPVLQVFDAGGRSLGFAKIGDSAQARLDVRAEAASLERISTVGWDHLQVPRVLHLGMWTDMVVLLQSALPTSPLQRPRHQWSVPRAAMDELAGAFAESPAPLADLPWIHQQRRIAERLANERTRATLDRCLDALVDLAGSRAWPIGAWHGDWTPWNMARAPQNGQVQLWDWERFETGVPRGLDPFHYLVNAVTRRDGTTLETIRSALVLAGAEPARVGSTGHVLAGTYLLAVAGRYLPLSEGPGGEHIAARTAAFVRALQAWLGLAELGEA
jgi:hypothetical protein